MSDPQAEYLKRTCLICGCHTNQTINIYEPRSGPNIVQLIQAKFKFQPLNEDKYLCFSCNNWLINWHSLQALNSNDAESPSGTFRSSVNNPEPENDAVQRRPVAQVRPRQLLEAELTSKMNSQISQSPTQPPQPPSQQQAQTPTLIKPRKCSYSKQIYRLDRRPRRPVQHKLLKTCNCGRAVVVRLRATLNVVSLRSSRNVKCRKCREVGRWRASFERSERRAAHKESRQPPLTPLVNFNSQSNNATTTTTTQPVAMSPPQRLQRPLVDGKVVSMLRRLGTTLSRESVSVDRSNDPKSSNARRMLPIMSPAKAKPRWTRQLDDDEILLNFDSTITEVLPFTAEINSKRKLNFELNNKNNNNNNHNNKSNNITESELIELETECENNLLNMIPRGLSVLLI